MRIRTGVMMTAAACAMMAGAGCNVLGPVAYLVHGPNKVDAAYTLDPAKATLVFVDDSNSKLPSRSLRADIAANVEKILLEQECLKDVIDFRNGIQVAATEDRAGAPMAGTQIGQRVGAAVVIFIEIEDFGISPDGQTFSPFAFARVKVLDAVASKRLWPEAGRGYPVQLKPNPQANPAPTSMSGRLESSRLLAEELGHAVAQVFYTHEANNAAGQGELQRRNGPFDEAR